MTRQDMILYAIRDVKGWLEEETLYTTNKDFERGFRQGLRLVLNHLEDVRDFVED